MKEVIDLSDDDPLEHSHSSDDDDNPGRTVAPHEKKPTILPSGKVKVEGDWWTYEAEKRDRRIARDRAQQEECEAKEREVAATNAKLAQVQAESEKKISSLQSQMDELRNMLLSQCSQQSLRPVQTTSADVSTLSTAKTLVAIPSYPRVEDTNAAMASPVRAPESLPPHLSPCRSPHVSPRTSSAASPTCSLDELGFESLVSQNQEEMAKTSSLSQGDGYPRLEDTLAEISLVVEVTPALPHFVDVPLCGTSTENRVLLDSPVSEERVDYGEGEEELYDKLDVEKVEDTQQGPGDTKVHCSDPYHFD